MNVIMTLVSVALSGLLMFGTTPTPPSLPPSTVAHQDSTIVQAELLRSAVLLIGVDNYWQLSPPQGTTKPWKVSLDNPNCSIFSEGDHRYIIRATQVGHLTIEIEHPTTQQKTTRYYRIETIADPVVRLGGMTGGTIAAVKMKVQSGLIAHVDNMDMDARCRMLSFDLMYSSGNHDPISLRNKGGRFTGEVAKTIKQAKSGDRYVFSNVIVRCPGDVAGRRLNTLVFDIR